MAATRVGDVDGHGLFGVLEETDEGLLCHDCGWRGQHLGLHVYRVHGLTASGYRFAHGLKRTRGLVGAATRAVITENATLRYASPAGAAFRRARDPAGAALVRLAQGAACVCGGCRGQGRCRGTHGSLHAGTSGRDVWLVRGPVLPASRIQAAKILLAKLRGQADTRGRRGRRCPTSSSRLGATFAPITSSRGSS